MKLLGALFGVVVVAGAAAQDSGAKAILVEQVMVTLPGGCPVAMSAGRQAWGKIVYAAGGPSGMAKSVPDGASVSLVLVPPSGKTIRMAQVEVEYRLPHRGLVPAEVKLGETTSDQFRRRQFTVQGASGSGRIEESLSIGKAGTIVSVRLLGATYQDGSALTDVGNCLVKPSPVMLVAAR